MTDSSNTFFSKCHENITNQPLIEDTCMTENALKTQNYPKKDQKRGSQCNRYHLDGICASSIDKSELTEGLSDFLTCTTGSRSEDYAAAYRKPDDTLKVNRPMTFTKGPRSDDTSSDAKDSSVDLPVKSYNSLGSLGMPESYQRCQLQDQVSKVNPVLKCGLDKATPFVVVRNPSCKFIYYYGLFVFSSYWNLPKSYIAKKFVVY